MNKPVIAGIAAGVLLAGFVVFGPLGQLNRGAQAQSTCTTSVTDAAFDPIPAEISTGDIVNWTIDNSTPPTVTSGSGGQSDGEFDSSPTLTL